LAQKHTGSDAIVTAADIIPLVAASLDLAELAGKLEDTTCALSQQIAAYDAAIVSPAPEARQRLRCEA
jgi:hypothetical protein